MSIALHTAAELTDWIEQVTDDLRAVTQISDAQSLITAISEPEQAKRLHRATQEHVAAADELRTRAWRRVGELLHAARDHGHLAPKGRPRTDDGPAPATLATVGLSSQQASTATRLAEMAPSTFERVVAEKLAAGRRVTPTAV